MPTAPPFASLGVAVLLGAGLGAAALTALPNALRSGAAPTGDASSGAPVVPRAVTDEATAMLRAAASQGFSDGRWRIAEPTWTRERQIARDPAQADLCQIRLLDRAGTPVLSAECRDLVRHLLGDVEQFLSAYRVAAAPTVEGHGVERSVTFEWRRAAGPGPVRRVRFLAETGQLVRLDEQDPGGVALRSVEWLERGLVGWSPQPLPHNARPGATPAERDRTPAAFGAFAARTPVPIYEPARLPPRFARVDFGFDQRAPAGDVSREPLPLAWVAYTDGLVRMNLFMARRADMRRLEGLARQQTTAAGHGTCPTSPASTPEEMVEGADAVLVFRRDDGCRVVLRRDDLPDVAVALVGYRGLPPAEYVETLRSLVRVSPTRPGEVPLHDAASGRK